MSEISSTSSISRTSPGLCQGILTAALLPILLFALTACGTPTPTPRPAEVPTTAAVVPQPEATTAPVSNDVSTSDTAGMAAPPSDTSAWTQVTHTTGGVTYSYRY